MDQGVSMTCPVSSSSSPPSHVIPSIIGVIIVGAVLILCLAVAGVDLEQGPKQDQFQNLSQVPRLRSTGRSLSRTLTVKLFSAEAEEEEEEEEENVVRAGAGASRADEERRRRELDTSSTDEEERRRERESDTSSTQSTGSPSLVVEETYLTLLGNILDTSPCEKCYMRSILISPDETTIFFARDTMSLTFGLFKAVKRSSPPPPSSSFSSLPSASREFFSSYHAPEVISKETRRITGLEILDENRTIIMGFFDTPGIWEVDVGGGNEGGRRKELITGSTAKHGIVRHPREPFLFAAAETPRVLKIPLPQGEAPLDERSISLAGGNVGGNEDDNVTGSNVLFSSEAPRINPRSISADGSFLYVADRANFAVRRVNTTSGATHTLGFANGSTVQMPFGPLSAVVTSDDCNLFVTGWANFSEPSGSPTVLQWLAFDRPHGNVWMRRDVVIFNATPPPPQPTRQEWTGINEPSRLLLSHKDTHLYVGTSNGEILLFEINRSALHKCGPHDPDNPPGFGPLPRYVRPPPSSPPPSSKKKAIIALATVIPILAMGLGLVGALLLRKRCKRLNTTFRSKCSCSVRIDRDNNEEKWMKVCFRSSLASHAAAQRASSPSTTQDDIVTTSLALETGSFVENEKLVLPSCISCELECLDSPRPIAFAELRKATNGFSQSHKVVGARGGFGDLYRASLRTGGGGGGGGRGGGGEGGGADRTTDVALKMMRGALDEIKRRQFLSEVTTLSRARHAHLCKLLGFCFEGNVVVLVYPFISGGSLFDRLHPLSNSLSPRNNKCSTTSPTPPAPPVALDWTSRLSVVLQIGTALRYLHEELDPPLYHRDVKSSNILVEGTGKQVKAYLTDFGLAKLGNPSCGGERGRDTVNTVYRAGTAGYMAPEYAIGLRLTSKNDVYAFGVVLLEIVTGRTAVFYRRKHPEGDDDDDDGDGAVYSDRIDSDGDGGDDDDDNDPILLVLWFRKRFQKVPSWKLLLRKIVDPQLVRSFDTATGPSDWERKTMYGIARLGRDCTDPAASKRPTMGAVVERIKAVLQEGEG